MNDIIKVDGTINVISEQEILNHKFNIYGTFTEPYFLAKDVSEWIGHTNTSKMLVNIDEDEKNPPRIIEDIEDLIIKKGEELMNFTLVELHIPFSK